MPFRNIPKSTSIGDITPRPYNDRKVIEILEHLRDYPASEAFKLRGIGHKGRWVEACYVYPIKLDDMVVSAGSSVS